MYKYERVLSNSPTSRYRAQHEEIIRLIGEFREIMPQIDDSETLGECRVMLLILTRKLAMHLSLEDQYLYPRLISQPDTSLREAAITFRKEICGMRDNAERWADQWSPPDAIRLDPDRFRTETDALFAQLNAWIRREETQLYPMIDEAGWSAVTGVA